MNELPKRTRQHYEKNEAGASLLSTIGDRKAGATDEQEAAGE
jgi:hypothetical protein